MIITGTYIQIPGTFYNAMYIMFSPHGEQSAPLLIGKVINGFGNPTSVLTDTFTERINDTHTIKYSSLKC